MSTDFELFPGKNLSGLFKDIYDNQQNKKQRISELIAEMKKVIRHRPFRYATIYVDVLYKYSRWLPLRARSRRRGVCAPADIANIAHTMRLGMLLILPTVAL